MRRTLSLLAFGCACSAGAHEKWFYDATKYPARLSAVGQPFTLGLIGAVLVAAVAGWLWQRARGGRELLPGPAFFGTSARGLTLLYAAIPAILAVHAAVPLVVSGVLGDLFSPNNKLLGGWQYPLGLLEVGIALALFYGGFTRLAALALVLLWLLGLWLGGVWDMLDNLHFLGLAAFFWLAGRGPYAVGRLVLPSLDAPPELARFAVPALRVLTALSLIATAFSEKLANPALSQAFLHKYLINLAANLGLPISDVTFALLAGAVELTLGVFLLFNIFPRLVILVAWLPFNLTLTVFGWQELVGHLPYYGIMALLLIWPGGKENEELWRRGLHETALPTPPSRAARTRGPAPEAGETGATP